MPNGIMEGFLKGLTKRLIWDDARPPEHGYFEGQIFFETPYKNVPLDALHDIYEGPAKSFVTGFGLLQCYVLSNIFLLQTFKVFPLY